MNATLEILEIGVGGGPTLSLYPANTNLTVLEPNQSMVKYFEEARQKNPHINYKKIVIAMAEDMHQIDDDSFDVVVGIYVLCSVQSVRSALKEVKRVLKSFPSYTEDTTFSSEYNNDSLVGIFIGDALSMANFKRMLNFPGFSTRLTSFSTDRTLFTEQRT
ncbi:Methyltransferase-like protein 7B like protein [Argiope bruennichi]|uniref:Methyltransferase-like protein 7B like protein n=1 Tax=Argiope bruennichi TaxID=94029 RepID=A0A8T0EKH0_ARGBR|nr:Methyltransferase-like protein 7B like protein [Argiope bruennichi]